MIKQAITVIKDFSGGQDTKTPIISMGLEKSPNMRNFHCAGMKERLIKRDGYAKVNPTTVESDNLDVFYPPGYQTYDYPLRTTAAYTKISQGFKPNTSSTVTKVRLWLKSVETPAATDTVTLEIQTESKGVPSGSAVTNGTATAVDISDTLTSSYAWVEFTFATNPTLVAGTQYHLVLEGAFTISAVNYVNWGADDFDVIYPDGSMSNNDGTTWVTDTLRNACFEVYITGGAKGNDGYAMYDFASKHMMLGIFGTSLYKMDKDSDGTPDGSWDSIGGGSSWDTYTKLMLHCDGSDESTTITDEIGNTVSVVGTAEIDTAQKVFGTGSLLLDGDSDYVTVPDSTDWDYGNSAFTIDFRVRWSVDPTTSSEYIYSQVDGTTHVGISYDNNRIFFTSVTAGVSDVTFYCAFNPAADTWYHISIVRINNENADTAWRIYVNGVSQSLTLSTGAWNGTVATISGVINIGAWPTPTAYFTGWLDEFRISKGIARWTSDFTPPTAAYSGTALPITSSRYWTFADWQSGRVLINTDIGLYSYIGSGNAAVVSGAPIGKFCIIFKNYVFIAGIRGSPNTVRYSDLTDYTTWTATQTLNFDTNDGDVITGMRILRGKLYIFKRYSIHRVSYLGSNPTFQVDQILGIGTPSHYTIKEVDLGGEIGTVLIFLTTEKTLAIFDGYSVQIVHDKLSEESNDLFGTTDDQPLSFADMNLVYSDLFHAVIKADTSEYILYCVLDDDTTINYSFVFDYKVGGIFPYDGQPFAASSYVLSTNKSKILYCSGYTGYMWQIESGNSDDGSDINAYWVSGKIRPELVSLIMKALQLGINFKQASSASELLAYFQFRIDWNVSWTTAESFPYNRTNSLTFGESVLFDIGTIENMLQIKIYDDSANLPITLYNIDLYGQTLGLSVGDKAVT